MNKLISERVKKSVMSALIHCKEKNAFKIEEVPLPELNEGETLLKTEAFGINRAELIQVDF